MGQVGKACLFFVGLEDGFVTLIGQLTLNFNCGLSNFDVSVLLLFKFQMISVLPQHNMLCLAVCGNSERQVVRNCFLLASIHCIIKCF